jgi:prolyl oligopeptidase
LAARGGSNGGLLTGAMLTQYPDSFGALSIEVPLLDMKRYTKLLAGASWIAEYGDPDKSDEWAFMQTWSPYHRVDATKAYPATLLLTSTKDDRVHPGHARKMAALLQSLGKDVRYYENIEGGHGGAANNAQAAFMAALSYQFLWQSLAR